MELVFYFSSIVAVLATFRVITHTHPVHALLYLIISLIAVACVFFSLGAYFVGALEIIIYTGAIMVLFVFVVMMLNIDVDCDKQKCNWLHPRIWIGPSLLSLILLIVLVHAIVGVDHNISGQIITVKIVGIELFSRYILAVELGSMLLLSGLVTAFHLGKDNQNHANI